jgi:sulfotransferase family protein
MKCGTSTLQAQLAAQTNIYMATPKEPNFFSDDAIYANGLDWYKGLFADAKRYDLKGEASTHYTKLPTYPNCIDRMSKVLNSPKLIYMIRDPLMRAVSHYIHEWTMGEMSGDIEAAFIKCPELIAYGQYAMQIEPYVERFGRDNIHLTSLENLKADPQGTLTEIGKFLEIERPLIWQSEMARVNASSKRIRRFPLQTLLFDNPIATKLRRTLVPRSIRDWIKSGRQMSERPQLSSELSQRLEAVFAEDRMKLQKLFPNYDGLASGCRFSSK